MADLEFWKGGGGGNRSSPKSATAMIQICETIVESENVAYNANKNTYIPMHYSSIIATYCSILLLIRFIEVLVIYDETVPPRWP